MAAPVLAIGDGALCFWAAVRDVFPETAHQRDWVHKSANVLDALPASVQATARRALREISPHPTARSKRPRHRDEARSPAAARAP
jgi:transposase-like protein